MKNKKMVSVLAACIAVLVVGLAVCIFFIARGSLQNEEKSQADTQEIAAAAGEETKEVSEEETKVPEEDMIMPEEMAEEVFEEVEDMIYITSDQVNLREEPSIDAEIVGTAILYKLVKRTGVSESWSELDYEGMTCYISNDYITTEQPELADGDGTMTDDSPSQSQGSGQSGGEIVVIDPGHQANGDSTQEPIGPGTSATKPRVSSGTTGCVSGWDEYELNLAVSLQLRDELVKRGYTVYMTRETHDVSMSNKERAEFATAKNADILVRIHANGDSSGSVSGALTMAPSGSNSFLASDLIQKSQELSQCILDSYVAATGFGNQGVYITDEMSGINWSTMPVTIVEMGYMTNASDDAAMADSAMQVKMVKGISDGIDSYFSGN